MSDETGVQPGAGRSFILEAWGIVSHADSDGVLTLRLSGIAFGSSLPLTGTCVRTSPAVRYRMQGSRLVIITRSGSEYMLGLRDGSQDEDKKRLVRYLDRISGARGKAIDQRHSETQTDILRYRGEETDSSGKSAA